MKADQIMTPDPSVALLDTPLPVVAELMVEYDCGLIPIVASLESMLPVGVLTDRDITCKLVAQGRDPTKHTAADCMSSPCVTVYRDDGVEECCRVMEDAQVRRVLVVNRAGQLCGIIAQADIAEFLRKRQAAEVVREISQRAGAPSNVTPAPKAS
jgi:CBS domain-containing protein